MQDTEIWKDIPGYESIFQASSQGRLRKLSYWSIDRVGNPLFKEERILKCTRHPRGYIKTRLYISADNFKPFQVHRIICLTFHGEAPEGMDQVNHINGIKDDNRAVNLEWSNNSLNITHAWANGLHKPKQLKSLQSPHAVIVVHSEYGTFHTVIEAAYECGINRSKLSLMVKSKIINTSKYILA